MFASAYRTCGMGSEANRTSTHERHKGKVLLQNDGISNVETYFSLVRSSGNWSRLKKLMHVLLQLTQLIPLKSKRLYVAADAIADL